tara:strand:- start:3339 stop:5372 length:2034 start_codon:yes stop_codon:yes gene_type:complete
MSQSVKEFVRRSGVEVQSPNSNNNAFARELEMEMIRAERAERAQARPAYSAFRTPPRPPPRQMRIPERLQKNLTSDPLANEFKGINENAFKKALGETTFNDSSLAYIAPSFEITKLNPSMFNANIESGFGPKDTVVNLKTILMKPPLGKTPIGEGLYIDTTTLNGIYGQFKTGFSHTREFGPKGDLTKKFASVQIKMQISNDTESKGVTFNIYKNGKIRFSSGFIGTNIANQPELIRRFVISNYTDGNQIFNNPIAYNNLSGSFRVNGTFKMDSIAAKFRRYGMTRITYEPELSPFLYAYFGDTKLILSVSGNVQISGAQNPADLLRAYDFAKNFVQSLHTDGQITITGVFSEGVKASRPKAKKVKSKTKANDKTVCSRMKKADVIKMAKSMGIVNFRVKTQNGTRTATVAEICRKIKNASGNKNVTFKNKNKNKKLSGTGNKFKIGARICKNESKIELLRIASILKIKLDGKEKREDLCKLIEKARNTIRNAPSPVKKPKPTKMNVRRNVANKKRTEKKSDVIKKRGLDEKSIRKDIEKLYGNKWMKRYNPNINKDARNMKSALNAITNGNKMGIPFKKNINEMKKRVVGQWKMERQRELERNYLMKSTGVNGIPLNMRNDYRRAAANYIMNQKNPPSNKKMSDYKKYWLKFRANIKQNGNIRRTVGAASARIEKL